MTPQDPDHKAMWEAIQALKDEINVNGYGAILRDIARRAENRRIFLATLKRPISVAGKLAWLLVGAVIWGIANHVFGLWPTGNP